MSSCRRLFRALAACVVAVAASPPVGLTAQSGMAGMPGMTPAKRDTSQRNSTSMTMMAPGPLGITHERLGSGTAWLPDASPMRAHHWAAGAWSVMLHGDLDLLYDAQGSARGDTRVISNNWLMLMAMRRLRDGMLHLHVMGSAEPWTVGGRGYPLLLQTGESFKGQPLKDHQHPHDLFMEIGALYEFPVAANLALSFYAAPVGEPAMGPVAFMHRPSAQNTPLAPIGHHWQDATHITYGVLTAGIYSRQFKLEGSVFNGREADEDRTNIDFRKLDSWSARAIWNPDSNWNASASYGFLKSPEAQHPDQALRRLNVAIQHLSRLGAAGQFAIGAVYGSNRNGGDGGSTTSSFGLEANAQLDDRNGIFGRVEQVQKSAEDLVVPGVPPNTVFRVQAFSVGYLREIATYGKTSLGLGLSGYLNVVPATLAPTYGTRTPLGLVAYLRLRPATMPRQDVSTSHHGSDQ